MGAEQFFVARQPSCRYPCADQDLGSRKPRRWKFCVRDANRFKKQKVIRKLVRKPFSEHGLAHVYARSDRLAEPFLAARECAGNAGGMRQERIGNVARMLAFWRRTARFAPRMRAFWNFANLACAGGGGRPSWLWWNAAKVHVECQPAQAKA